MALGWSLAERLDRLARAAAQELELPDPPPGAEAARILLEGEPPAPFGIVARPFQVVGLAEEVGNRGILVLAECAFQMAPGLVPAPEHEQIVAELSPIHRPGLERHPLQFGVERQGARKGKDGELGVVGVVVDDARESVSDHRPVGDLDETLGRPEGVIPAALGNQDRRHSAPGQHVVGPVLQDLLIGSDRRHTAVTEHQRIRADVPVFKIERAGLLIIRLGLVGLAELAQAARHHERGAPAEWPALEVVRGSTQGPREVIASVRRLRLAEGRGVQFRPGQRRQHAGADEDAGDRRAAPPAAAWDELRALEARPTPVNQRGGFHLSDA
jgi:hypothetical protein